jgi:hypothetical protein
MPETPLSHAATLSDEDLLRRVSQLAGRERGATIELIVHLAELDARKLYLGEGYGSLFAYCTGALRLAEHAAYNRIEAARVSRRFPRVLDLLADGSLNLTTVRLLAPHLRADNFDAVVEQARGRSKRDVEVLGARLAPQSDVACSVRKLPTRRPPDGEPFSAVEALAVAPEPAPLPSERSLPASGETVDDPAGYLPGSPGRTAAEATYGAAPKAATASPPEAVTAAPPEATTTAPPKTPAHRPVVAPLASERYRVQFSIGEATHEKLRCAQNLLRREVPDGDPGEIFDRALTLLLEEVARKKLALTSKPRPGHSGQTRSRHVPAHVKRAVWLRDGGRCAFVSPKGRRCTERAFLEFHHREPHAIGGETTVANISLRCRAHNAYEAELVFGSGASAVRDGGGTRRPDGTPAGPAR